MQPVLERCSIDKPLTFDVGFIQLSFIPVCSPNTCNIIFFQSNCAEGLHIVLFILLLLVITPPPGLRRVYMHMHEPEGRVHISGVLKSSVSGTNFLVAKLNLAPQDWLLEIYC